MDASTTYANALGMTRRTRAMEILSQNIRVCFVELADSFYIELITPLNDQSKIGRFLEVGFYHLCFLVDDLEVARKHLKTHRFFPLPAFQSEGFAGGRCQFFLSPQKHLIELAEMTAADFAKFFSANLETPT